MQQFYILIGQERKTALTTLHSHLLSCLIYESVYVRLITVIYGVLVNWYLPFIPNQTIDRWCTSLQ